jgi:hypothetical protein
MNNITIKICSLLFFLLVIIVSCDNTAKPDPNPDPDPTPDPITLTANSFLAVPMPSILSTGEPFPTDSIIVNGWVKQSQIDANNLETNEDIIRHGWGIWSALTEVTREAHEGQYLRRFETWYTPQDIIDAYDIKKQNDEAQLVHVNRGKGDLSHFNQFTHGQESPVISDAGIVGFVKYDPTAAKYLYDNKLFFKSVLESYKKEGELAAIPEFPLGGVSLKPVFATLDSINPATGNYSLQVWPGEQGNNQRSWGRTAWNNAVDVTINGASDPSNGIYSINDFIHFRIDSAQAAVIKNNPQLTGEAPKAGDYAVLLGMHVSSKENVRWTWQTFWWSANHNDPYAPSSGLIASLRPKDQLDNAANHYAMAVAYNMTQKAQANTGGNNEGVQSIYAYNPYLEAGFPEDQFTKGNQLVSDTYGPDYAKIQGELNDWGMQTNCMSCHIQATITNGVYLADQYVDMQAPYFKSKVTLDFAWSIQGNMIDDNGDPIE